LRDDYEAMRSLTPTFPPHHTQSRRASIARRDEEMGLSENEI